LAESEKAPAETRQLIESEVGRMDNIVEYQLQKAAAAGRVSLTKGVAILTLTNRLLESLRKVYSDKSISYSVDIDEEAMFMGEEGDLMEIRKKVSIKVERIKVDADTHARHRITIEDDGPGIIEEQVEILLQRGARGDTQTPGHGIGLAVVREIVSAYGGELKIAGSEMGGARVEVLI
jgi:two-component system sensor histidine kinase PhoQ